MEQPRRETQADERPLPSRVTGSAREYRRMFRRTRLTPRKSTLARDHLPRMAPSVTPASPPQTGRPMLFVPYVPPYGRFVRCSSDTSAGPSGHAERGKRKVRDEPERVFIEISEEEEDPEEDLEEDPEETSSS